MIGGDIGLALVDSVEVGAGRGENSERFHAVKPDGVQGGLEDVCSATVVGGRLWPLLDVDIRRRRGPAASRADSRRWRAGLRL